MLRPVTILIATIFKLLQGSQVCAVAKEACLLRIRIFILQPLHIVWQAPVTECKIPQKGFSLQETHRIYHIYVRVYMMVYVGLE